MYLLYKDDFILAGPDKEEIAQGIKYLKYANLDVTYEGNMEDFLGINIQGKDEEIHLTQPHLIEQIIKDLNLDPISLTNLLVRYLYQTLPACFFS